MQQCLTSIPCKSNAKEVSIHKVLITDFNVRFRVAIACWHRDISSRHFSPAKRSKNQKYVCVRILGLLLFKTKRKTFPGFSLTLHFTILFSFLSGYRYSLIFFHSIWWWLKEIPDKKMIALKRTFHLFLLDLSLTLHLTFPWILKNLVFARDS